MKIGHIRPQADFLADTWQRVYSHTIDKNEGTDGNDKLLIHFNGADAATTHTAATGQTVTFAGTAQLDTAQKKFGTASLLCDGNSDYATVPDSADWNFGTGNFTIDFWFKRNDDSRQQMMYGQCDSGAADVSVSFLGYFPVNNTLVSWIYSETEHVRHTITSTRTITDTDWHHYALVRNGTTVYQYIDGTQDGSVAFDHTANDSGELLTFGRYGTVDGGYFNGWLDEVRISKGIAKWTANFTPPTAEYGITSLTISDLDGNTEEEYELRIKIVGGSTLATHILIRPNNDTGANYGSQILQGNSTNTGAERNTAYTGIYLTYNTTAQNSVSLYTMSLYAKSGYVRTAISSGAENIATTTVSYVQLQGSSWNNTADNVTSLVILSSRDGGLGIGTVIELYARKSKV